MDIFLQRLSLLLAEHNVAILSTSGSIGFIKDCHEKSREELVTNRKIVNSYDLKHAEKHYKELDKINYYKN